jgi:hypothetical protein
VDACSLVVGTGKVDPTCEASPNLELSTPVRVVSDRTSDHKRKPSGQYSVTGCIYNGVHLAICASLRTNPNKLCLTDCTVLQLVTRMHRGGVASSRLCALVQVKTDSNLDRSTRATNIDSRSCVENIVV